MTEERPTVTIVAREAAALEAEGRQAFHTAAMYREGRYDRQLEVVEWAVTLERAKWRP